MTNEQIIQQAEKYAKSMEKILNYHHDEPETDFEDKKNAYIAGAHSRDEEIEELKKKIKDITILKNCFAASLDMYERNYKKLQDKLTELCNKKGE